MATSRSGKSHLSPLCRATTNGMRNAHRQEDDYLHSIHSACMQPALFACTKKYCKATAVREGKKKRLLFQHLFSQHLLLNATLYTGFVPTRNDKQTIHRHCMRILTSSCLDHETPVSYYAHKRDEIYLYLPATIFAESLPYI